MPSPSGPRCRMSPTIASSVEASTGRPGVWIPAIPHTALGQVDGFGVGGGAAGDPRERASKGCHYRLHEAIEDSRRGQWRNALAAFEELPEISLEHAEIVS